MLSFSATGSAKNFQVKDSEKVLGRDFSWEFRVDGSLPEILSVRQMKISAENLLLEGSGEIRIPEAAAAMDAFFEIKDLRSPTALESLAGWSTQGRANASWDAVSHTLSSRFQGTLKPASGTTPSFLAKDILFAGRLSFDHKKTLSLTNLQMVAPWGKLQGEGIADLSQESLQATWHLLLPDLAPLSPSLKAGPAEIRGKAKGPFKNLTLSAEATARDLAVSGFHLETTRASLLAQTGDLTKGSIHVEAQGNEMALQGHADFDWSDDRIGLRGISLDGGASRLSGGLSLFLGSGMVEGELKAECADLARLAPLLQSKVQGSALLQARFVPSGEGQKVSLLMNAENLEFPFGAVFRSRVEAQGILLHRGPSGRVAIEIQNASIGELSLPSSAVTLQGDPGNTSFELAVEGRYKDAFEMKSSGLLRSSSTEKKLTVNHLEGRYSGLPFSLLQPAAVARSSEKLVLGEWLFKLGSGQLRGSGYVRPADLSLDLQFDDLPLQSIPVQEIRAVGGLARGNASLKGNPARPEGTASLQIETLRFQDQGIPSAGLTLHAALRDNLVKTDFLVQGLSTTPLQGNLEGPLLLSLSPLVLTFPLDGEMKGSIKGEIPMEKFAAFAQLHEQKLAGTAELNVGLEGPLRKPQMAGWIRLKRGAYENLRTGTILREIEVDIAARPPLLVVNKATASDGESGRVSAQGQLELSAEQGLRFKLDLALEKVKPFRYDWASAILGGDLTLTGSLFKALLTGRLVVDTAEFRIPDRLAPDIRDLQVIEINKPVETRQPGAEVTTPRLWPLSLDLTVLSPGRVFLTGRGLTSEWQGEMRIRGEATRPSVEGTLSVVRGSVNFLGKRFELKKGSIFLDGSSPPSPGIDVEAESRSKEIIAYLHLRGPVQALEMKLSSDPPLPPDEILSRLLFGRSASSITPLQALQLADSVNTLARGGGLDLLARTRQLLSLDQLTLTPSGKTQEKTALSAGKYLSENVYLEVQQGISPETGKASLKWEITPNVSVQTEVGVNAEAGVGVQWRWDY
jgi:translocation and assembly module TamB